MGKRSAQAGNEVEARGIRDQSRMAATRYKAWGNAREPDGDNAGMPHLLSSPGEKTLLGAVVTRGRHTLSRGNPPLEGKRSAQCFPNTKGEAKKRGKAPWGHISPRSAIDRMSLPATIR